MDGEVEEGAGPPATKEELLSKAQEDIRQGHAQLEEHHLDAGTRSFAKSKQDCDVDLSHKGVTELPEELVDIIKDEVTRLALHRNRLKGLSGLSLRLPECTKLKYIVLRHNDIKEFPRAILAIRQLEVLDLKGNRLESLPEDLDKLEKLRALAVVRNKIRKLPICIARMPHLKMLSAWGNPIVSPPMNQWASEKDEEEDRKSTRSNDRNNNRSEKETIKIKQALETEQNDGNAETPKASRRKTSRPFVKPSIGGIDYMHSPLLASPMLPKPPPIPGKSLARSGGEPLSAITTRPGIAPLINNERNRSNSESQMATSVKEKRLGYVGRSKQFHQMLDMKRLNRLSHNRGLSHGSALQHSTTTMTDSSSPTSPTELDHLRLGFVNRLSSLPEGKRKSKVNDPSLDFAKGLLYSLNQVTGPIRGFRGILREGSPSGGPLKRTSLDRTTYTALAMVKQLNLQLQTMEKLDEDDEDHDRQKSQAVLFADCEACIKAFTQLGTTLRGSVRELVAQGNQHHIRTLMHLLYASTIEVRNACKKLGNVQLMSAATMQSADSSFGLHTSPESDRPATSLRLRDPFTSTTSGGLSSPQTTTFHISHQPTLSTLSRSTSVTSFNAPVPYPGDSLSQSDHHPQISTMRPAKRNGHVDEERLFIRIWYKLDDACELALQVLPSCKESFSQFRNAAVDQGNEDDIKVYNSAYERCRSTLEAAGDLRQRLATISVNDPDARNQLEFWQLCTAFTRTWTILAGQLKAMAKSPYKLSIEDIRSRVKPVHTKVKALSQTVFNSPWNALAVPPGQAPILLPAQSQHHGTYSHVHNKLSQQFRDQYQHMDQPTLSLQTRGPIPPANPLDPTSAVSNVSSGGIASGLVTPLPATPMSAALGPAVLATVPATQELAGVANGGYFGAANGHPVVMERDRSMSQRW